MNPEESDTAIVDRLRRGEREAFRELYRRYGARIFAFLLRLAGGRELAEDLHQETWLAVARHATRLRPDSDLAAWLFTIARNQYRSVARRRIATARAADLAVLDQAVASQPDPGGRDLERALAKLPEAHREILLLVGVEGLAIERAAMALEIRPDAARQRLARARAALAALLDDAEASPAEVPPQRQRGVP